MIKKKDKVKLNEVQYIKKRRMQKYHLRKIRRLYRGYELSEGFKNLLKLMISYSSLCNDDERQLIHSAKITFVKRK